MATRRELLKGALATPLLAWARAVPADECEPPICITFSTRETFLRGAFGATLPAPGTLVLDAAAQAQVGAVFARPFPQSRLRYWRAGGRAAWIFDDVGKEGYEPTTAGFIVRGGAIESSHVLYYRESRGAQVGDPSFLRQLAGARAAGTGLDRKIDNISGATYSVVMMQRMARTALALDALVP